MDKTKSIAEEKYKLLKVLDKTENVWKSKKSLTVAELVKSGKKAVKTGDITTIISLSNQLQQENEEELKRRTQIQEEKTKLFHDIELADAIDNKSFEFASVLKKAKNLSQKQKVELSNLKDIKNQLEKCLKVANDRAEKAKQEALAKADEEALLAEQVRNSPRDEITSSLAKLASFPDRKSVV